MESPNTMIERLGAKKVDLPDLVDLNQFVAKGVSMYQTNINDLHTFFASLYQSGRVSELNDSVGACFGGIFRSSRLNQELFEMGVETSKKFSPKQENKGLNISKLIELIKTSEVTPEGYLKPNAFERPLKTLFLFVDPESNESIELVVINKEIKSVQDRTTRDVKMDIFVLPEDESQMRWMAHDFESRVLKKV